MRGLEPRLLHYECRGLPVDLHRQYVDQRTRTSIICLLRATRLPIAADRRYGSAAHHCDAVCTHDQWRRWRSRTPSPRSTQVVSVGFEPTVPGLSDRCFFRSSCPTELADWVLPPVLRIKSPLHRFVCFRPMRREGFEPSSNWFLRPACLPFHQQRLRAGIGNRTQPNSLPRNRATYNTLPTRAECWIRTSASGLQNHHATADINPTSGAGESCTLSPPDISRPH
jgi:hypothetical protein